MTFVLLWMGRSQPALQTICYITALTRESQHERVSRPQHKPLTPKTGHTHMTIRPLNFGNICCTTKTNRNNLWSQTVGKSSKSFLQFPLHTGWKAESCSYQDTEALHNQPVCVVLMDAAEASWAFILSTRWGGQTTAMPFLMRAPRIHKAGWSTKKKQKDARVWQR